MSEQEKPRKRHYKRTLIVLALLSTVSLASLAYAVSIRGYYFPHEATPTTSISLAIQIDWVAWANGTTIDWGEVEAGKTYNKTMTVTNTDTRDATVYITVAGLPLSGWTLTWAKNNTEVLAGAETSGLLQLTTPDPMTETTPQTWDMWVRATPA